MGFASKYSGEQGKENRSIDNTRLAMNGQQSKLDICILIFYFCIYLTFSLIKCLFLSVKVLIKDDV